jgi:serine/threonine protein kinase
MRLNAMLGIVSAIEYLHSGNIIHRDVKSGNCFLSYAIEPWAIEIPALKLGDLGLARPVAMENMTRGAGTMRYMAPEVITSHSYGLGADIFSLGIMLHELVTGEPPFSKAKLNEGAIAAKIVQGVRPSLESLSAAAVNVDLPNILESCWAQEASIRLTASEVIARLYQSIQLVPPNAA